MKTDNKRNRILEVCCADLQSVRAAVEGGAQRIELCQALELDGVTPSAGMIEWVVEQGVHIAHMLGASGVVIGALTPEGDIDTNVCGWLMGQAQSMSVTFHRAFDQCRNPQQALEDIISMGCHRLLTSGQAANVTEGTEMLARLVKQAAGRITILPGCGISPENAHTIISRTGAHELHGSLRKNGHTDAETVRRTLEEMRR